MPTYHSLHVETADVPRTSLFDLPYDLQVVCTRSAGWELWRYDADKKEHALVAGEYAKHGLRLDVDGRVIVDSLTEKLEAV